MVFGTGTGIDGRKGGAMASATRDTRRLDARRATRAHTSVPMILDSGAAARVAAIDLQCEPYVGMRFVHDGTVWEITRANDHARGWVAQPVPLPWSAS